MNFPNPLTLLRIFPVPLALAIFLSAAADLFDGYLARRRAQVTSIGTLLDPIGDKLLISSAWIAL